MGGNSHVIQKTEAPSLSVFNVQYFNMSANGMMSVQVIYAMLDKHVSIVWVCGVKVGTMS